MYMMVIKASLLVVAIIVMLGAVQARPVTDLMLIFIAGGVVPGTNLVVPAQIILVSVAAALMVIFALLFRRYVEHRATMQSLMPEYEQEKEDPTYSALVPGLSKVIAMKRVLRAHAGDLPPQLYVSLRFVVRRLRALAAVVRKAARITVVAINSRTLGGRTYIRQNMQHFIAVFRKRSTRALTYLMRITTF